jgi:hypothetical protein
LPRGGWRTAAKVTAGFFAGLALWLALSDPYAKVIAAAVQPILRLSESPPVTRLRAEGPRIIVDRSDFPVRSARPNLPLHDQTFNIILLTALFASNTPLFSNRNVAAFLIALLLLFLTHVLGFVAAVKSVYALQLGAWSEAHYGPVWRNFWAGTSHFYRLVGMYAIAFLLWWALRPAPPPKQTAAGAPKKRRRRK